MTSRVALCNEALALLGDKSIVDVEEQTPQGRACAVSYGAAVLAVHPWGLCDAAGGVACGCVPRAN